MMGDYDALLNSKNASMFTTLNYTTLKPTHQVSRKPPIVFWCFLTVQILVILFGNGMLCWLFFCRRNLRTLQNYFVLSLSVSDFLVGLTIAPCEYCTVWSRSSMCPLLCGSVLSFNMLASTINLILIAADRYYSIMRPFTYQKMLSKRRAKIVISIGWLTTLSLTLVPLAWAVNGSIDQYRKMRINFVYGELLFGTIILIGIMLGVSYYRIVHTIKSKLKATKEKSSNPAGIKVCLLVAISFFVCWLPTCVSESLVQSNIPVPREAMDTIYFFFLINPCLDPILYAYYRREFRHHLERWMCRRWNSCRKVFDRRVLSESKQCEHSLNNNSSSYTFNKRRGKTLETSLVQSGNKSVIELSLVTSSEASLAQSGNKSVIELSLVASPETRLA